MHSAVQVAHKGTLVGTAQVYTSGMEYAHYYSESGLGHTRTSQLVGG